MDCVANRPTVTGVVDSGCVSKKCVEGDIPSEQTEERVIQVGMDPECA